MSRILLFGGFVQALSAAVSLKQCGHSVLVAAEKDAVAQKAKYIEKYIEFDKSSAESIGQRLIELCLQESIDVVVPMEDGYAAFLSRYKKQIEKETTAKCAIANRDSYDLVSDKAALLAFCKQHNIGHPRTEPIDNNYEWLAESVGFPALIKPNHSEGSKGIVLVNNLEELKEKAPEVVVEYGECTLQEYIQNDHYYNLMLFRSSAGVFSNHVILKILRYYPIKGGSSCLAVSVENEPMVEMCKRLLNALNWVGMADFDILEKGEGDFRIIEINPRVPASLRGAEMSGVNFPEIIVSDLVKGKIPRYEYKTGKYLRFLGLDIAWFLSSPNRFKCNPSWFKFFGKELFYEDGGWRDRSAMITYIWSGIKKQMSPKFRKSKAGLN